MSRTYRHEITGSKARLRSCRNHGSCPWCRHNRTYTTLRGIEKCRHEMKQILLYGYQPED